MKNKILKFLRKELKLKSLSKHKAIGIDLDGTLISGPYCKEIQAWAKATKAELHVITFRKTIPSALASELLEYKGIHVVHMLPREIEEFSDEYLHWKGKICHKYNLTALIDDDVLAVMPGCLKHKIQLFNSLKWPTYDTE